MEDITDSIIQAWRDETECSTPVSSVRVKHQDHILGIYTLYFNIDKEKVRIKALLITPDSLLNKLKKVFGMTARSHWKIINMT